MSAASVVAAAPVTAAAAAAPTASASAASSASASAAPHMPRLHNFSVAWMDEQMVHVQLWLLDSSVLVWAGLGSSGSNCRLANLSLAMRPSFVEAGSGSSAPAASLLLGGGSSGASSEEGQEEAEAALNMSSRLAAALSMPVAVSLSLGGGGGGAAGGADPSAAALAGLSGGGPELRAFVERVLLKEIKTCQKLGMLAKPASPAVQ